LLTLLPFPIHKKTNELIFYKLREVVAEKEHNFKKQVIENIEKTMNISMK
jgi:hypothetical protein